VKPGCEKYHVPKHVQPHLDLVTPSVHFDTKIHRRGAPAKSGTHIGQPGAGVVTPKSTGTVKSFVDELENCDTHITPLCLRALYGIVYVPLATDKNSYGIVEYTPQAYLKSDLDMFFANYSSNLVGKYPKLVSIDGGRFCQSMRFRARF
jgi:tripeptidyl-peptidase-1